MLRALAQRIRVTSTPATGVRWFAQRPQPPAPKKTPEPRMGEAAQGSLVSTVVETTDKRVALPGTVHREFERDIRHSPQKMNMIVKLIRGLPIDDAIKQMQFSHKRHAREVCHLLKRGAKSAALTKSMDHSKLYVAEAYVNKGIFLPRVEFKGRGRTGMRHRPRCHVVVLMKERTEQLSRAAAIVERMRRRELRPRPIHWL